MFVWRLVTVVCSIGTHATSRNGMNEGLLVSHFGTNAHEFETVFFSIDSPYYVQ